MLVLVRTVSEKRLTRAPRRMLGDPCGADEAAALFGACGEGSELEAIRAARVFVW